MITLIKIILAVSLTLLLIRNLVKSKPISNTNLIFIIVILTAGCTAIINDIWVILGGAE